MTMMLNNYLHFANNNRKTFRAGSKSILVLKEHEI